LHGKSGAAPEAMPLAAIPETPELVGDSSERYREKGASAELGAASSLMAAAIAAAMNSVDDTVASMSYHQLRAPPEDVSTRRVGSKADDARSAASIEDSLSDSSSWNHCLMREVSRLSQRLSDFERKFDMRVAMLGSEVDTLGRQVEVKRQQLARSFADSLKAEAAIRERELGAVRAALSKHEPPSVLPHDSQPACENLADLVRTTERAIRILEGEVSTLRESKSEPWLGKGNLAGHNITANASCREASPASAVTTPLNSASSAGRIVRRATSPPMDAIGHPPRPMSPEVSWADATSARALTARASKSSGATSDRALPLSAPSSPAPSQGRAVLGVTHLKPEAFSSPTPSSRGFVPAVRSLVPRNAPVRYQPGPCLQNFASFA